jgi:predicted O-linked N-acetylglucosamine transferase (SPINDLY family)
MSGTLTAQQTTLLAQMFQEAWRLHRQGRRLEASEVCDQVIKADPHHHDAWHLRGLLALESGQVQRGMEWIEQSLLLKSDQPAALSNLGNAWLTRGEPSKALGCFERALLLKPDYTAALYNQGNALRELNRLPEALASYDTVLRLNGQHMRALNNRGLVLLELGKLEEAHAAFSRAAQLDPVFTEAARNAAACLLRLSRREEALAGYEQLLQRTPGDAQAWAGLGNALLSLKRLKEALESFTRSLTLDPQQPDTLINRGNAYLSLKLPAQALADSVRALDLTPGSVAALNNAGNALLEMGQAASALDRYDEALALAPGASDTLYNRGAALRALRRFREAAECYAAVVSQHPGHDYALGNLFHLRMDYCSWNDYDFLTEQLRSALVERPRVINPLSLLLLPGLDGLPLACARAYVEDHHPPDESLGPCVARRHVADRRIRVAYLSADFREHPVSYLLVGALEHHDRERFEIIGVSLRERDESALGQRVRRAFEHFIEVQGLSDREVAARLRELQVDIAVDLMGLTDGTRLGIFARRTAPVQVNFLGMASTSGASYMDYLIADGIAIPEGEEGAYAERIVRLPDCFLPNDDRREIAAIPRRAEAGLPESGLVLCAFTNPYKINPPVFAVWMRLLSEIPDSVLWLRVMDADARESLAREALARGVDPRRLLFAPHVPGMPEHLARKQLADLYLDTVPYNAHSTACDALWAGVPVLTCTGGSFASRVAASAVAAAGLPELITHSLPEYEARALELLRDPPQLAKLRARLEEHRLTCPLFNTSLYTRHLEAAYQTMHQCALEEQIPRSFSVKPQGERA